MTIIILPFYFSYFNKIQSQSIKIVMLKILLILLTFTCLANNSDPCEPFGLRLYYGDFIFNHDSKQKAEIYFNTKAECDKSHIRLITKTGTDVAHCQSHQIKTSQNMGNYIAYVQKCSLQRINFGEVFSYTAYGRGKGGNLLPVPSKQKNIDVKLFDLSSKDEDVNLAVTADWGPIKTDLDRMTPIIDSLKKVIIDKNIHAVVINGDLAYDLDSNSGLNYIDFVNFLGQISSRTPIIHVAGNHQHLTDDDQLLYMSSFKTYGNRINRQLATGIEIGSLYLLPFDPYRLVYGKAQTASSLQAFNLQLQQAVKSQRFIIPLSHYPLICSVEYDQCNGNRIILNPFFDSMLANGVTLHVGAHTHVYERNYPYLKNHQFSYVEGPYKSNGQYLVSVVEGVGGNEKAIAYVMKTLKKHTAKYTVNETGFGVITSRHKYVSYAHFSTKQGFMDEIIIEKVDLKQKESS